MKNRKFNLPKLRKAVDALEMKSNYVNSEYYHPIYMRVLGILLTEENK